jgi:hypothetical protein
VHLNLDVKGDAESGDGPGWRDRYYTLLHQALKSFTSLQELSLYSIDIRRRNKYISVLSGCRFQLRYLCCGVFIWNHLSTFLHSQNFIIEFHLWLRDPDVSDSELEKLFDAIMPDTLQLPSLKIFAGNRATIPLMLSVLNQPDTLLNALYLHEYTSQGTLYKWQSLTFNCVFSPFREIQIFTFHIFPFAEMPPILTYLVNLRLLNLIIKDSFTITQIKHLTGDISSPQLSCIQFLLTDEARTPKPDHQFVNQLFQKFKRLRKVNVQWCDLKALSKLGNIVFYDSWLKNEMEPSLVLGEMPSFFEVRNGLLL